MSYICLWYAEVSEADLYQGNMRFDVNVSVSKDLNSMGTRTETKNLNSFRSVEKAVEYEVKRQVELLEKGIELYRKPEDGMIINKKLSLNEVRKMLMIIGISHPDIPPLDLSQEFINDAIKDMPALPGEIRQKLKKLELDDSTVKPL